jgi:hypothetical protein
LRRPPFGAGDVRRPAGGVRQPAPTAGLTAVAPATDAEAIQTELMLAEQHYQNAITASKRS